MELASSCWYLVRSGIQLASCLSCCCWRSGMDMFGYPLLLSRERPRHGASVFLLVSGTIRQHLPSVLFVLLLLAIWYGHVWISFARCLASGRGIELLVGDLVRSGSIYRVFCLSCCWRSGMDMFGYPLLAVSRAAEASSYLLVIWYDRGSTERCVCLLVVGDLVWTCLVLSFCSLSRERPWHVWVGLDYYRLFLAVLSTLSTYIAII